MALLAATIGTLIVYLQNLQAALENRNVEASLEAMLWHYAFGKPKEHVEWNWKLEKLTETE